MTGAARPAMLGYFVETFLMTPTEQDRVRNLLLGFADRAGSQMTAIYMEALESQPAAIEALIEAARRGDISAVAITAADSIAAQYRRELEGTGVRLLIARDSP
ncbi:hypothetical protein [Kribbella speibonae]|uniref:Uncharacterized protein n=1 Tax=Kribbella speibonae TaxID=1572660 RepID=A0A4R0IER1_9ACTN|nr:hypothetical protein [Kribbella speibonae]TCC29686.1 hypothetical protein E0H92_42510 [Kribbella speibonae]